MLSKLDCAKAFVSDVARTLVSSEGDGFSFSDDLLDVVSKLVERMLVSSGEDPARIHASKKEFFASCKEKKDDKEWKGIPRSLATLLEYFLVELLMGGGREMFLLGLFFFFVFYSCFMSSNQKRACVRHAKPFTRELCNYQFVAARICP